MRIRILFSVSLMLIAFCLTRNVIDDGVRHRELSRVNSSLTDIQNKLALLDKMAIKKNDYNSQSTLLIKADGSMYIPIVVKDEPTKQKYLADGTLTAWQNCKGYYDMNLIFKKTGE